MHFSIKVQLAREISNNHKLKIDIIFNSTVDKKKFIKSKSKVRILIII